jgi:hypothetical protein
MLLFELIFKDVHLNFLFDGKIFVFIPIPVIKYFSFLWQITSCSIPQIFFSSISRSFGFLIFIIFFVYSFNIFFIIIALIIK